MHLGYHLKCSTVSEKPLCSCQAWHGSCSKPQGAASHGLLKAAFSRFEPYINDSAWGPTLSSTFCISKLIFTHKTDRVCKSSGGVCSLCLIHFSGLGICDKEHVSFSKLQLHVHFHLHLQPFLPCNLEWGSPHNKVFHEPVNVILAFLILRDRHFKAILKTMQRSGTKLYSLTFPSMFMKKLKNKDDKNFLERYYIRVFSLICNGPSILIILQSLF